VVNRIENLQRDKRQAYSPQASEPSSPEKKYAKPSTSSHEEGKKKERKERAL
jgi:hypothetical protein